MMRVFVLLAVFSLAQGLVPTGFLDRGDKQRMKSVLDAGAVPKFQDVSAANYILKAYKLLGTRSTNAAADCKFLRDNLDSKSVESIHYSVEASLALGNCKIEAMNAQKVLTDAVDGASTQTLFQVVTALRNLKKPVPEKNIVAALSAAVKKDDSLASLGYAFHAAAQLTGDVNAFYDRIEDVVIQADEIDGKYLQFEGGIGVTAMIISGIYRLSETAKRAPPMTNDQVAKFTNYILNRKTTQAIRGLYYLLDSLTILTNNKFHVPVSITLASNVALSKDNPVVKVRVTNVLGEALPGKLTVTADTVTRVKDAAVILSKEAFAEATGDSSLFEMNPTKKDGNLMGTYKISVSAVPKKPDPRFIGTVGSPISVNFMVEVDIRDAEIGTAEIDQSASPKLAEVRHPSKLPSQISADSHQRLVLKFNVKNRKNNAAFSAHQVFLQLTNTKTKQEITFVHEHNEQGKYKFDIDLKAKAADFGRLSGLYSASVLVGDRFSSNSYNWKIADVSITFSYDSAKSKSENIYAKKPEIKHVFRQPEPRPSEFISNLFTGLIFVPILILFILWIKLGVNVSNFSFSLSALGFHVSLGAAFALFCVFWMCLDMFVTIKYLLGLSVVIFLCGNNLLSSLARKKK